MKKLIFFSFILAMININMLPAQELDPGDGVRIIFYNIADANSGDFFIQQDHSLQLPNIGFINTSNIKYLDLKKEIVAKYDSLYRGVELIVSPLYKINVLGEVRNPGVYYSTGVEKLLDLIAMAGGETEDSNMSKIIVERTNRTLVFNAEEIIRGDKKGRDFYVKSGDRIYVTRRWWVFGQNIAFLFTAALQTATLIAVLSR